MDAQVLVQSRHIKSFTRLEAPSNPKVKRSGHYPKVTVMPEELRATGDQNLVHINTNCSPEPPIRIDHGVTYANVNRPEESEAGPYVNVPLRNGREPKQPPVPQRQSVNQRHSAPQLPPRPNKNLHIHVHVHSHLTSQVPHANKAGSSTFLPVLRSRDLKAGSLNLVDEISVLDNNRRKLLMCGWYHEKLSFDEASEKLKDTSRGTFLLRNSSDPRYLYALSVQQGMVSKWDSVSSGPTAIRVVFSNGQFHLDVQSEVIRKSIATFDSVIELVEYYMKTGIPVDSGSGPVYSISLTKPLYKDTRGHNSPPSLEHLSRLSFHQAMESWPTWRTGCISPNQPFFKRLSNVEALSKFNLPPRIQKYLMEYPHTI